MELVLKGHMLGTFKGGSTNHVIREGNDFDDNYPLCSKKRRYKDYQLASLMGPFSDNDALRLVGCTHCQKVLRGLGAFEPKEK